MSAIVQSMRRAAAAVAALLALALCLSGCAASSGENTVVIYSSGEGMRNEALLKALHEEFPQYDIRLHYLSTGNNAARLRTEGSDSEADIVFALEGGYARQIADTLADLPDVDMSIYVEDLVDPTRKTVPFTRESACIAVNDELLREKGLPVPESYEDLLDPQYKGLISMANPKTSGTAYNFLKNLVNVYGEEEALAYFDKLAENVYQFTSSGSGPINALVQGEAAIGLGLTFQAVTEINQGVPLSIHFFEEGSPWDVYSIGIIEGKQDRQAVLDVFNWLATEGIRLDNELFSADQVLRDFKGEIENYPSDIVYADMTGITDLEEKERLLKEWKY
ncbi:MAG: extracellular solute-binding protein [Eggerthellaceae bacterium]|nr:extracellular solute-binding protein [Eggerthellaceae bacterium]